MPVGDAERREQIEVPLEENSGENQDERALRIARLQKEIAAGTYQVDAAKLAARMVEAHLNREK